MISRADEKPWRLDDALGLAPTLHLGLEQRTRVEQLDDATTVTALSTRTLLNATLQLSPVFVHVEWIDARLFAPPDVRRDTTLSNALDLQQLRAGLRTTDLFTKGDTATIALGRFTLDLGSRRLVARNEFRNTINAFTGLDALWSDTHDRQLRLVVAVPVERRPDPLLRLPLNAAVPDRENFDRLLWAAFVRSPLPDHDAVEGYVIGLHERDSPLAQTSNRRLVTAGARWMRPPAIGAWDFQLELMAQWGTSRAGNAGTTDLAHRAAALHASAGATLAHPWKPRLVGQYDFASGDADPTDGRNERFDPLFGARRFEFGPTGLYGLLSRANTHSPGIRLEFAPDPHVDAFVSHRLAWLASATDAWSNSGLRDPTGTSGTFVGRQWEARVRWHVFPRNLVVDVGGAVFLPGDFLLDLDGHPGGVRTYGYAQVTGTI